MDRRHALHTLPPAPTSGPVGALVAGLLLLTVPRAGFAIGTPASNEQATDSLSKIVRYPKADSACRQIASITPPPPPVGRVVVGTLDAKTGIFTWNPSISIRPWTPPDPNRVTTPSGVFASILTTLRIPPVVISLGPWVRIPTDPLVVNGAVVGRLTSSGFVSAVASSSNLSRVASPATSAPAAPVPMRAERPAVETVFGRLDSKQRTPGPDSAVWLPVKGGPQDLVFHVANLGPGETFTVTVGRYAQTMSSSNTSSVDVVVPLTTYLYFTVTVTGPITTPLSQPPARRMGGTGVVQRFTSPLVFDRPPIIGCFTLEAFPVAMVYEPPGSQSSQTYGSSHTIGTNVRTFSATDSGTNSPVNTPFSEVNDFIQGVGGIGQALSAIGASVPWAKAAGSAMETAATVLKALWGSSQTTETITERVSEEHSLAIRQTNAQSLSTGLHLGPGRGDVIHFLLKPVFLWLAASDPNTAQVYVTVALISYKGVTDATAEALRTGVLAVPTLAAQRLLLQTDPLTQEYQSVYPGGEPGRLVTTGLSYTFTGGSSHTDTVKHQISKSDAQTLSVTRNVTTTEQSGILAMVGLPTPKTGTTSMTTVHEGTTGTASDSTTAVIVTFRDTGVATVHEVLTYFDTKFGTFAFKEVPPGTATFAGSVTDSSSAPVPNARVELLTPGMRLVTWTNREGKYAFRPTSLKPGTHTLVVGTHRESIAYTGVAITKSVVIGVRPR